MRYGVRGAWCVVNNLQATNRESQAASRKPQAI